MDSGNSGSICSSGDEEYDSRSDTVPAFLNPPTHFGSISHPQYSSLLSHHQSHNSSLFDLSPSYLQGISQSEPNSNSNSMLNLDTSASQSQRSEANCTDLANQPGVSSAAAAAANQSFLARDQSLGQCTTDPSLELRSVHDDNAQVSAPTNAVRNSKKRTRASRRAPTTVLTTDTSNFRSMVQEFTGIPAPPFSGSSYSRRLNLLTGSSSLRSSATHLESTGGFYPLRPSAQKVQSNPLLLSSSASSTLLHNNMIDAIASTTTTNNSSAYLPDLGLPYNQPQNILNTQNHPFLPFQTPLFHPLSFPLHGISAKSQTSLEDLSMSHGQVNAHLMSHGHATSHDGMALRNEDGYRDGNTVRGPTSAGRRDQLRSLEGNYGKIAACTCKLNFSASSSSCSFNHEKTLDNTSNRGEATVDSWICSSD